MKTIKALLCTLKEKRGIFRLEDSSCCVASIHGLVFAKDTYPGHHREDCRKYSTCQCAPRH